ncbi:MAG TPA: gliding motility-associated C-terminal domain-containing protein [Saprospiraceae bacterium]|nr:gliding motility-associated C-terminal domain-containing protein [Saprospiraceae bacterium]
MPKLYPSLILFLLMILTSRAFAQPTVLSPGDIMVLGVVTDLTGCGKPLGDEISFVCFKDITSFTTLMITDNGWETSNFNFWGDSEGTLKFTRVAGTIPAGTVITLRGEPIGANWTYSFLSPDNGWAVQNQNIPGGVFDLEAGGDQFYFLQGGTWNNQGGGMDMTIYDGTVIYGFNTLGSWIADGTTHQSNIHPDVIPCYNMSSGGSDFYKYTGDFTPTYQLEWWHRNQDAINWKNFANCTAYNLQAPDYAAGFSIPIDDIVIGITCLDCDGCAPFDAPIIFHLPPGVFDILYTDGTTSFSLLGISDFHIVNVTISDTHTYTITKITEVGGCPLQGPFSPSATINVPHNNPGHHATISVCPTQGLVALGQFLGVHDAGGLWSPPLDPINGIYYSSFWGPGTYTYYFKHPGCPSDTATVTVYHVNIDATILDIGCDVNGTPNDITDDRMTVTLNVMGSGFGPDYWLYPTYLGVATGSISPGNGLVGIPTTFFLDPGTATTDHLAIVIQDMNGWQCIFKLQLPAPGFCSDPCDHTMTATISGDEDTCPNSCPDNPAHVYVDITGGQEDYSMDFSVTASGFPTWTFTDVPLEISTELEICVADVPEAVYDEATHSLLVPKILAGHDLVITLLNVYGKYGCTAILDNDQQFITIHALPQITAPTLTFCKGIANDINLTDYDIFISTFLEVTWSDGNPLEGGDILNNPTGANLLNVVQLWAMVEDDYCANSIQVPLTILPQPDIDSVGPLDICKGDIVVLQSIPLNDAGMSMPVYTFHSGLPPDTTNLLNPLVYIPADTTTVYVLATAGMCFDTLPIVINVQDYPDFNLLGSPCDMILHTYSIVFTSSADSIHASVGQVVNNLTGQDSVKGIPENVNVSIEVLNASHLCRDTFLIIAPNCNCPLINPPLPAQPSYAICEGSAIPVLTVTIDPGMVSNWYNVPSGGIPLLQNSLTYQPPSAVSAIYYSEALDPLNNCYSIRTQVPFDVYPVADLQQVADQVLCEPGTINLNTLAPSVLNGVGGSGLWFDLTTNLAVSGVIQPQNGDAWYYLFTSNPGNCPSKDTIQASVNPMPTVDLFNILCDDASLEYEVSFTSDADNIVVSTGNLTNIAGTDSFSLTNIPFDTDIQFDLTNTVTGCINTILQAAPDCSCPALLQNSSLQICSDQATVDLSTFEGLGVVGNWQLVSTPPGSNPATLTGTNFQGVNKDAGMYVLRFIRSVILADCVDTASFQLQLHNSPFVDAGSNATVCAPDVINLFGSGGGDNVVFQWQETGSGSIANPNALNTSYTPTLADITAGSVSFTLTATDQTGFCPPESETITITIDGSAYFIISGGSQVYCDTADIQVDFDDLISFGNTNGTWFFPDTVSAPISGSSIFNPSTLSSGNYTVFYTTSNAVLPCKKDTVGVNLIIRNCACPSVAISAPTQGICSESGIQELNDFLITGEQGIWSIVARPPGSKPATLNGTKFVANDSDEGIYRLRFTLSNPVAGCDDFAEISIEVIATPSLQISSVKCAADLLSWEAIITSSSGNITNTQGNLTSIGNGQYLIDGLTLLTNVQVTASSTGGLCTNNLMIPAPDCACTLSISNLPDDVSLCPNDKITFDAIVSGAKGNVVSYWIVANDSLYQNSLEVAAAGVYHFVSIDELGCRQEKQIDVSIYTEMAPDVNVVDITCPGDQDGVIILNDVQGGNGPYFISINGGTMQPVTSFPFTFTGLRAGIYKIDLLDGFSCTISFNLTVESVSAETLSLGPDIAILVGDSVNIRPVISFVPDTFYWTGDLSLIDPLLLDNWIKPEVDEEYSLFAIDSKGCLYSDDLKIKVLLHSTIYIPTVFSPNDDGINDLLTPLADPSVTIIEYFEIFSRWGDLVYSQSGFPPNQTNKGWDGTFDGKKVLPGVYVYRLSAKNKKDKIIQLTGDITILR